MAIVELEAQLPPVISRRELLGIDYFFSRGRSRRGQPPRRPDSKLSSPQPEPPDFWNWFNRKVSRREVGLGVLAATLSGGGGYIAHKLGWLFPTTPDQTLREPETLEDMVAETKRMEDSFKDKDLSNKQTRERYAGFIASIVAINSGGFITKEEILSTIIWTNSLEDFVHERLKGVTRPSVMEAAYRREAQYTTAATDIRTRRMIINTKANAYEQENLDALGLPYKLNPLKMLRISLFHEFQHLVKTSQDDELFLLVFGQNAERMRSKIVEGFRVTAEDDRGYPTVYNSIHEATLELLSKDYNERYFGSFSSNFESEDFSYNRIIQDLDRVLKATGITINEVRLLHRESNLRGFLLLLMSKVGAKDTDPQINRMRFAMRLLTAIERNDQKFIEDFLSLAMAQKQF